MNDDDTALVPDHDTPSLGGERGTMRTADADRDRVVELLNVAFSEGRLAKDEYDDRLENAFAARSYADLANVSAYAPTIHCRASTPACRSA